MSEELKPCPFCGAEARYKYLNGYPWVECSRCDVVGPDFSLREPAIAAWNTRPGEDAAERRGMERELEEARDIIETALIVGVSVQRQRDPEWDGSAGPHSLIARARAFLGKGS